MEPADSHERVQGMESRTQNILMTNRDDVLFWNQMHHIENKTVLFEYEKEDLLCAHHLDRSADGVVGKHRGTLFGKLNEQNLFRSARDAPSSGCTAQPTDTAQNSTDQDADPPINQLQLAGVEWRSHRVTVAGGGSASGVKEWQEGCLISIFGLSNPDS